MVSIIIDLEQPNPAIMEILEQLPIVLGIHFSRPNDLGAVDIRPIVNPFMIVIVLRAIPDND